MNLHESIRNDLDNISGINEATQAASTEEMINVMNRAFPGANAVSTTEWNDEEGGIWFRGTESLEIEGLPFFNDEVFPNTFGTNPAVEAVLSKHGWFSEPYDAGTLMAYPV